MEPTCSAIPKKATRSSTRAKTTADSDSLTVSDNSTVSVNSKVSDNATVSDNTRTTENESEDEPRVPNAIEMESELDNVEADGHDDQDHGQTRSAETWIKAEGDIPLEDIKTECHETDDEERNVHGYPTYNDDLTDDNDVIDIKTEVSDEGQTVFIKCDNDEDDTCQNEDDHWDALGDSSMIPDCQVKIEEEGEFKYGDEMETTESTWDHTEPCLDYLSPEEQDIMQALLMKGGSQATIAEMLGRSVDSLQRAAENTFGNLFDSSTADPELTEGDKEVWYRPQEQELKDPASRQHGSTSREVPNLEALPLTESLSQLDWAKRLNEVPVENILFTEEYWVPICKLPNWTSGLLSKQLNTGLPLKVNAVFFWIGVVGDEIVGPFRFEADHKMSQRSYQFCMERQFVPWLKIQEESRRNSLHFLHGDAFFHKAANSRLALISGGIWRDKLVEWTPSDPDLNPARRLLFHLHHNLYRGQVYPSKDLLWNAICNLCMNVTKKEIRDMTNVAKAKLSDLIGRADFDVSEEDRCRSTPSPPSVLRLKMRKRQKLSDGGQSSSQSEFRGGEETKNDTIKIKDLQQLCDSNKATNNVNNLDPRKAFKVERQSERSLSAVMLPSREPSSNVSVKVDDNEVQGATNTGANKYTEYRRFLKQRKVFECDICGVRLSPPTADALMRHRKKFHSTVYCPKCNVGFPNETELKEHMDAHKVEATSRVTCDICQASFSSASNLQMHRIIHQGIGSGKPVVEKASVDQAPRRKKDAVTKEPQIPNVKRETSDVSMSKDVNVSPVGGNNSQTATVNSKRKRDLVGGVSNEREDKMALVNGSSHSSLTTGNASAISDEKKLKQLSEILNSRRIPVAIYCDLCNFSAASAKSLAIHKAQSHDHAPTSVVPAAKEPIGSSILPPPRRATTKKSHSTAPFSFHCNKCRFQSPTLEGLAQHKKATHSSATSAAVRQIRCEHCLSQFETVTGYNLHAKRCKPKLTSQCHRCNKVVASNSLHAHLKQCLKNKSVSCEICHKYFAEAQSKEFKQHMEEHKAAKKFECELCQKGFTNSSNLQMHLMIHKGLGQR